MQLGSHNLHVNDMPRAKKKETYESSNREQRHIVNHILIVVGDYVSHRSRFLLIQIST